MSMWAWIVNLILEAVIRAIVKYGPMVSAWIIKWLQGWIRPAPAAREKELNARLVAKGTDWRYTYAGTTLIGSLGYRGAIVASKDYGVTP
jgi:hypothetical protein